MPSIIDNAKARTGQTSLQPTQGKSILQVAQERTGQSIGAPQIGMPEMRTPEQMETQMTDAKELPFGAIGWKPDGTADYGQGFRGWLNMLSSQAYAPVEQETTTGEKVMTDPSALTVLGRATWGGVMQVAEVLSLPQQWFYGYLADRRSLEMYADIVNSNTPDIYQDNELGNFLRLTNALIPGISNLTTMYEKDRIKNGSRILPEGTFEKIQEANRIWNKENVGTSIFNTQVQAEYIRRVLAGENPYELTKEYSRPVENLITDVLLDPMNIFDGFFGVVGKITSVNNKVFKGLSVADDLKDVAKGLQAIAEGTTEAAKVGNVVDDLAQADTLIDKVVNVFKNRNTKALNQSKNISTSLSELTQDSKRSLLQDKIEGIMIPLVKFARGDMVLYDKFLEAIRQLGDEDIEIAKAGAKFLQENKVLHLFLNENTMEVSRFMNMMYKNTKNMKVIEKAILDPDNTKYLQEFNKIAERVFEDMYPDVNKIADGLDKIDEFKKINGVDAELPKELAKYDGYSLSKTGRWIARLHKSMQTDFLGTKVGVENINEFFSLVYLTSPGFAARNYMNAAATSFIDFGPKGLRDMVDLVGSEKYVEDMFGLIPGSISKAFSAASTAKKAKEATGIAKPFAWMRALANKGEQYESMAIAATAGKKFSNEMLREMKFIESMDNLRQAGFSSSALKNLESLVRKYNGQTDKALNEFKKMFENGAIEHFREPEMIFSKELLDSLNGVNEHYIDEIREILKAGTLDEVLTKVDTFFDELVQKSQPKIDTVSASYDAEESQKIIEIAIESAKGMDDIPDATVNKIIDAVVGQVDETGQFTGSADELAQIAEDSGEFAEATSKAIKSLIADNGLTLNQVDLFSKKVTVRIHLMEGIKNVARDLLSGEKRRVFNATVAENASRVYNTSQTLTADIIEILKEFRAGKKTVADLAKQLAKDERFARMKEFVPAIDSATRPGDVPKLLWDFQRQYISELYNETVEQAYKLLNNSIVREGFGSIGNVSKAKMTMLDQQFEVLFKYLNADKIINGSVYINEPYYWYKRGELERSIIARGKQLGLFSSEIQFKGDKQLHRATIWQVVKKELQRTGVKVEIGNVMDENNYRMVMSHLDNYAVQRNKLLAMRGAVDEVSKPITARVKELLSIEKDSRTVEQMAELNRLIPQADNYNNMKKLISKKLSKGDVQDIDQFTTDFVGWYNKSIGAIDNNADPAIRIADAEVSKIREQITNIERQISDNENLIKVNQLEIDNLNKDVSFVPENSKFAGESAYVIKQRLQNDQNLLNDVQKQIAEERNIFVEDVNLADQKLSDAKKGLDMWYGWDERYNAIQEEIGQYENIWHIPDSLNKKLDDLNNEIAQSIDKYRFLTKSIDDQLDFVETNKRTLSEMKKSLADFDNGNISYPKLDELKSFEKEATNNIKEYNLLLGGGNENSKQRITELITQNEELRKNITSAKESLLNISSKLDVKKENIQVDRDILKVIEEASLQNVKMLQNVPEQDATMISEIVSKLLSEQPEIVREAQDAQKVLNEAKKIAKTKVNTKQAAVQADVTNNADEISSLEKKEEQIAKAAADAITNAVNDTKKVADDLAETMQKAANQTPQTTADDMLSEIKQTPDLNDGNLKTPDQAMAANIVGIKKMFDAMKDSISKTYGKSELVSAMSKDQLTELGKWATNNERKMLDFRMNILQYMKETRDFALLDYAGGKRNIDLAMAYLFPYQFWYSRTYGNWIKRLVSNPAIITRYAKYREFLQEQNKNLPSYMQNYIVLGESIGMKENPLMLNLEASLNPMNGLTGVDFTDKNKIVGTPGTLEYALTKTIDSVGKFGPSPWSPYNFMLAGYLASKGEKEAASRWLGRAFPQTAPIKAVGSLFNQNWELDPFVILFGDGSKTDPYESRRVGRALVALTEAGEITKEQAYEAARTKSGDVWNKATIFATKNRALGNISSYMLGQGFKVRSTYEAEIDKFYEEYFKMWANADKFTPDEMSNYQRYIRTKYSFADLVILSGKGSEERDKAYSYSVLSRIAPGQSGDIFRALGVDPALTDKFYQDKGNMQQWNPLDKEAFMNAMVQIGTLVAIPSDTTASEWQQVKTIYKQVDKDLQARFGDDILTKIEAFYELPYDSPEQKNYMEAHPDVAQALDYKDFVIAGNKQIAPYYDGLNRLERYYGGEFRRQVGLRVDPNYYQYYQIRGMIIDPAEQKAFDRQIGWDAMNKKYTAFKKEWDLMVFKQLDNYDKFFLGEATPTAMQVGVEPSVGQQAIQEILAPAREDERRVTWQQITSAIPMPITLERALQQYVTTDRQLSSSESAMVTRLLNNVNTMYGLTLDRDELLSLAMDYYQ